MNKLSAVGHANQLLRNSNQNYIDAATRPNTRKAYQADIRHFIHSGGLLPTTPEQIIQYLATTP